MVARHEADPVRGTERLQEDPGGLPLVGQPEIAKVAGAGDVIDTLAVQVSHERAEQVHVVVAPAAAAPVHVAGGPLAEELAQARSRQRSDMRIGEMGEAEHVAASHRGNPRPRQHHPGAEAGWNL